MMSKVRSRGLQSGLVCSMIVGAFVLSACGGGGEGGDPGPAPAASSAAPSAATPQPGPAPTPQPPASGPATTPAAAGTASLAWTPPTEKEDGTALADLSGYKVYAGRAQDALELVASLDNPGLTRHVVENLASGTWFFAITAVARDGIESAHSNLAQKSVN